MNDILRTKNQWMRFGRIVKPNAKHRDKKYFEIIDGYANSADPNRRLSCKKKVWRVIHEFFCGNSKHEVGDLNKICRITALIARYQGKNKEDIVDSLLANLRNIPEYRRNSSIYTLNDEKQEKRIKKLVINAINLKYIKDKEKSIEKLQKVALKFTSTNRDVLKPWQENKGMP